MKKKATKKKSNGFGKLSSVRLQILSLPNCKGEMEEVILYDPKTHEFIKASTPSHNFHRSYSGSVERIGIAETLKAQISNGSHTDTFKTYMEIPSFRDVYKRLIKGAKPIYKEGDVVWKKVFVTRMTTKPQFYKVGKIVGWRQQEGCDPKTKEPLPLLALREFVEIESGSKSTEEERGFEALKSYDEWEEGKKAILAVKKQLKLEGLIGGKVHYAGNVYAF